MKTSKKVEIFYFAISITCLVQTINMINFTVSLKALEMRFVY